MYWFSFCLYEVYVWGCVGIGVGDGGWVLFDFVVYMSVVR